MTDLPNEIIYLILSKINNNQSIFNCRLACKLFYNYFTPLKVYNKGMHIETFVFAEPNVLSYYPSGKIKSDYELKDDYVYALIKYENCWYLRNF